MPSTRSRRTTPSYSPFLFSLSRPPPNAAHSASIHPELGFVSLSANHSVFRCMIGSVLVVPLRGGEAIYFCSLVAPAPCYAFVATSTLPSRVCCYTRSPFFRHHSSLSSHSRIFLMVPLSPYRTEHDNHRSWCICRSHQRRLFPFGVSAFLSLVEGPCVRVCLSFLLVSRYVFGCLCLSGIVLSVVYFTESRAVV